MKLTPQKFIDAIIIEAAKHGIEMTAFIFLGYKKNGIVGTTNIYLGGCDDRVIPDLIANINKTIELEEAEKEAK